MLAYQDVAQSIGASAEWLRKFIKGSEAKEPTWTIGWNLLDQYNKLCNCVEQENETERQQIHALKRDIDAATAPFNRMVATAPRAQALGTDIET
jgi:hypothetical protein